MSTITFAKQPGSRRTHDSCATLDGGVSLYVAGAAVLDEVELIRCDGPTYMSFRVTAAQARALGDELLAAANAVDAAKAAKGVAHG